MFKYIVFAVIIALGAVAILAMKQPDEFYVSRSAKIPGYAMQVFPYVNNLKAWEEWSPWKEMDPKSTTRFAGPPEGVGAFMGWEGDKTGKGGMTITQSRTNDYVEFRLDFEKPMTSTSMAEFRFKPEGKDTLVTWTMYGKNNFPAKVFSLFMNCEKMVGDQFDKGLSNLKNVVTAKKPKE